MKFKIKSIFENTFDKIYVSLTAGKINGNIEPKKSQISLKHIQNGLCLHFKKYPKWFKNGLNWNEILNCLKMDNNSLKWFKSD